MKISALNFSGNTTTIELIPDFGTMQSIEYHENGKISRIVFRSADEIIKIAESIECYLKYRVPSSQNVETDGY